MAIENTVSSDFYPCPSIVESVFDCRLSGVVRYHQDSIPILPNYRGGSRTSGKGE